MVPLLALCLALAPPPAEAEGSKDRPVVGLVLGGGGAKGIAHVGVLKALEELQVPVDLVVGTSMGAIAGGLYAQGHSPDMLESLVLDLDWQDAFRDAPARALRSFRRKAEDQAFPYQVRLGLRADTLLLPLGVVQGQRLTAVLRELSLRSAGIEDFDALPLPFRATAVDLDSGEVLALGAGDLALAMRASMAIPGAIAPVDWAGRLLVDGGLANNLPIDLAREMGADIVIAVDVGGLDADGRELTGPIAVMDQALHLMIRQNVVRQLEGLGPDDILLQPDLAAAEVGATDFGGAAEALAAGLAAARGAAARLQRLAVDDARWQRYVADLRGSKETVLPVDFIRLDNRSRLDDRLLLSRVRSATGEPLDVAQLHTDIERIFGLGYFDRVDYRYLQDGDEAGIEITAVPHSWGPRYLRFGIALEDDFDANASYHAAISLLQTEINRWGAEFQADLEVGSEPGLSFSFLQPLRADARAYVKPWVEARREDFNVFSDGALIGRYRVAQQEGGLAVGRELGTTSDLRVGMQYGRAAARVRIDSPQLPPSASFATSQAFAQFRFDTLDDTFMPRRGGLLDLRYDYSSRSIGADDDFQRLTISTLGAFSIHRNSFIGRLRFGQFVSGEAPAYLPYTLGGFFNLSGFERNELTGSRLFHVQGAYLRQVTGYRAIGGFPVFLGGALEAGNVWDSAAERRFSDLIPSASAIGVLMTPIGALYLGFGVAEGGRTAAYLSLGRLF